MEEFVQVKAEVPRHLKRRTFAVLAMRDDRFARWLRRQMEQLLEEVEAKEENRTDGLARPTERC